MSDRLRSDAAANHARILEAAYDAFAIEGLDVSVDEIARRAGVGTATLYRRFAMKEDLIAATFAAHMSTCEHALDDALADPDPWRGFSRFITRICLRQHELGSLASFIRLFPHRPEFAQFRARRCEVRRRGATRPAGRRFAARLRTVRSFSGPARECGRQACDAACDRGGIRTARRVSPSGVRRRRGYAAARRRRGVSASDRAQDVETRLETRMIATWEHLHTRAVRDDRSLRSTAAAVAVERVAQASRLRDPCLDRRPVRVGEPALSRARA